MDLELNSKKSTINSIKSQVLSVASDNSMNNRQQIKLNGASENSNATYASNLSSKPLINQSQDRNKVVPMLGDSSLHFRPKHVDSTMQADDTDSLTVNQKPHGQGHNHDHHHPDHFDETYQCKNLSRLARESIKKQIEHPLTDEQLLLQREAKTCQEKSKLFGSLRIRQIDSQLDTPEPCLIDERDFKVGGETQLDQIKHFEDEQKTVATFNKKLYMQNFSLKFQIPSQFVLNARIFQKDPDYFYVVTKVVFPPDLLSQIKPESLRAGFEGMDKVFLVLRHRSMKKDGKSISDVGKPIELKNLHNNLTTFSADGSLFAYVSRTSQGSTGYKVVVVKTESDDKMGMLEAAQNAGAQNEYYFEGDNSRVDLADPMTKRVHEKMLLSGKNFIDGIQKIKFDINNTSLVGYGGLQIFYLNLRTKRHNCIHLYEIYSHVYESIIACQVCSGRKLSRRVWGATYEKVRDRPRANPDGEPSSSDSEEEQQQILSLPVSTRRFQRPDSGTHPDAYVDDDSLFSAKLNLFVAAKRRGFNQIHVLDFFRTEMCRVTVKESSDEELLEKIFGQGNARENVNNMRSFNFEASKDGSPQDLQVLISHDFKLILFNSPHQHFVIEMLDVPGCGKATEFHQFKLRQIKYDNQKIIYAEEDLENKGFLVVSSRDFDDNYRVYHSHQREFKIKVPRRIENFSVQLTDLFRQMITPKDKGYNPQYPESRQQELWMLGHDCDEFIMDVVRFRDEKAKEPTRAHKGTTCYNIEQARMQLPFSKTFVDDVDMGKYSEFISDSMSWPIITIANRLGYIFIMNAFHRQTIQCFRLKLHKHQDADCDDGVEYARIYKTFVSIHKNIFILVLHHGLYKLYWVNLDKYNIFKLRTKDHMDKGKEISVSEVDGSGRVDGAIQEEVDEIIVEETPLVTYREDEVEQEPSQLFIRDAKDSNMTGEHKERFMFVLHGKTLWMWNQSYQSRDLRDAGHVDLPGQECSGTFSKLTKVDDIADQQFYADDENSIFYLVENSQKKAGKGNKGLKKMKTNAEVDSDGNDQVSQGARMQKKYASMTHEVRQLHIDYVFFEQRTVYVDPVSDYRTVRLLMDIPAKKFLLLKRKLVMEADRIQDEKFSYRLVIYDYAKNAVLIEMELKDKFLKDLLLSGQFQLLNGHIYTRNDVTKIRYDYFEQCREKSEDGSWDMSQVNERLVFDHFENILDLSDDYTIPSKKTVIALHSNKIAWTAIDKRKEKPGILIVTPFLHERRIYFGNYDDNPQNFMTAIKLSLKDRKDFNENLKKKIGIDKHNHHLRNHACSLEAWSPSQVANYQDVTCLARLDLNSDKLYVYAVNGQLLKRVDYKYIRERHGRPLTTSSDGQCIVFAKERLVLGYRANTEESGLGEAIENYLKLHIYQMTPIGFLPIESIDIIKSMHELNEQDNRVKVSNYVSKQLEHFEKEKWGNGGFDFFLEHIERFVVVSNEGDICVRLRLKPISDDPDPTWTTLYYFQRGANKLDRWIYTEFDPVTKRVPFEWTGMNINERYVIFWNQNQVATIKLSEVSQRARGESLNHLEKVMQKDYEILNIRTAKATQDSCTIAIIAQYGQVDEYDYVFIWDLETDKEKSCHKVSRPHVVLFDDMANAYIAETKKVTLCRQRASTTAFDIDPDILEIMANNFNNTSTQDQDIEQFYGLTRGNKCDGEHCNWILMNNYVALPYSYMCFVVQESHFNIPEQLTYNVFDLAPYNYLFNGSSAFLNMLNMKSDIVRMQLPYVLEQMYKLDKDHLCILNFARSRSPELKSYKQNKDIKYTEKELERLEGLEQDYREHKTALHIVFYNKDTPNVEQLLKYMALSGENSSYNFKDILHQLIDYKNIMMYLQSLLLQTDFMASKTVYSRVVKNSKKSPFFQLWYPEPKLDELVVQVAESNSTLIDKSFYDQNMKENAEEYIPDEKYNNVFYGHPVQVQALKVDWLLSQNHDCHGRKLMEEIVSSGNMAFFKLPVIQIYTQYVYNYVIGQVWMPLLFSIADLLLTIGQMTLHAQMFSDDQKDASHSNLNEVKLQTLSVTLHVLQLVVSIAQVIAIASRLGEYVTKICPELRECRIGILLWAAMYTIYFAAAITVVTLSLQFLANGLEGKVIQVWKIRWMRYALSFAWLFQVFATLQYLKMSEDAGQFIDLVMFLLTSIWPVVPFLLIFIFSFALVFYLIGQNQIDFEIGSEMEKIMHDVSLYKHAMPNKSAEDIMEGHVLGDAKDRIRYRTFKGALAYMLNFLFGNADDEPFYAYEDKQNIMISYIFLWLGGGIIIILLTNMIIALMSDAQALRTADGRAVVYKTKLALALQSWGHIVKNEAEHKSTYLIAALSADNQQDLQVDEPMQVSQTSEQRINSLQSNLKEIEELIKNIDKQEEVEEQVQRAKKNFKKSVTAMVSKLAKQRSVDDKTPSINVSSVDDKNEYGSPDKKNVQFYSAQKDDKSDKEKK